MTATLRILMAAGLVGSCGGEPRRDGGAPPADVDVPVAINPDSPFSYPPALFDQGVEGDAVLRLFVDSSGRLVPESTRLAESSGNAILDSAALAGAGGLRFAPATRRGVPVSVVFLQPVRFRRPEPAAPPPGNP